MQDTSWESFFYGNTCVTAATPGEQPVGAPKRNLTYKKVSGRLGLVAATLTTMVVAGVVVLGGGVAPNLQSRSALHRRYIDWQSRVAHARKTLSLDMQEAADFLNLSLSTLQKLEAGDTEMPQPETRRKYQSLIELEEFLKRALDNRHFAIISALRTPKSTFDGLTALEFAKRTGDDGVDVVLDILKRIHA